MQISESNIVRKSTTLIGFSGESKATLSEIVLPVWAEGMNLNTKFVVMDNPSAYNIILGRPWIHEMKAVPSTYHQVIRFPTPWGVKEVRGEQFVSRDCYQTSFQANVQMKGVNTIQHDESRSENEARPVEFRGVVDQQDIPQDGDRPIHGEPSRHDVANPGEVDQQGICQEDDLEEVEELDEVQIHPDHPDHKVFIGSKLNPTQREELIRFLGDHHDCFAWSQEERH